MSHVVPQNVENVAAYILSARQHLTTMKLHTLLYYAQTHSLRLYNAPLFHNRIEAWSGNPVIPELFEQHRGKFMISDGDISGNVETLSEQQREAIHNVLDKYGNLSGNEIRELSRSETPWINARVGYKGNSVGGEISIEDMLNEIGR